MSTRMWAVRRRIIIVTILFFILSIVLGMLYMAYVYTPPSCFNTIQDGTERGIDCGGSCARICAFDVAQPVILWQKAFKIVDGQYNVVAYVENPNRIAATPELKYHMTLSDENGIIVERTGSTILPPDNVYPIFEGRVLTGERVPTSVSFTFEEPELWLPASQARDQFTLVDRGEIINADSAPRLESALRNNSLETAKDVEVVATIFDAENTPLTASRTFMDFSAETVENVIFTWPEPIAKTIRSCEVPTDVVLAIDLSGSMNNEGGEPAEPLASVKRAAESFVNRLGVTDRVSIVTFATRARTEVPLTINPSTVSPTIAQLNIASEEETGSTNSGDALALALAEFNSDRHNQNARKVLVLLTDGLTNEPEPNPESYALQYAQTLRDEGVAIYTIGLGADVNTEFLRAVAGETSQFYTTLSKSEVDRIYRTITEAICEEGAARVDVLPKANTTFMTLSGN